MSSVRGCFFFEIDEVEEKPSLGCTPVLFLLEAIGVGWRPPAEAERERRLESRWGIEAPRPEPLGIFSSLFTIKREAF